MEYEYNVLSPNTVANSTYPYEAIKCKPRQTLKPLYETTAGRARQTNKFFHKFNIPTQSTIVRWLFVVLFYSYTKRFTALCHLVLGVGLSLAPIGAYLAVTGSFALLPILFSFTVLFWVSGFDIIYALQDEDFDKSNQLHSIPAAVGKKKALRISEMLHVLSAACVVYAGIYGGFGLWYWIGVVIFSGMLVYQHSIVKPTDLRRVNIAFMTANGIASIVFAVFVLMDLFIKK